MSFAVVNLGCRVNRSESDAITQKMLESDVLAPLEVADVVFINTCTVTGVAEKKTRKTVRHVLDVNKSADVIVTGCASEINPDFFKNLSDRVKVIPKNELLRDTMSPKFLSLETSHLPARVNVKIQDGCNNACTFCIVHVARGKSVSFPQNEVIKKCSLLDSAGVREIILTGINLGNYSDPTLCDLLTKLLDATKNCRFRISSIEPPEVTDDLLLVIKNAGWRVCRHFHLPLQSGSDAVLKAMDRHYSRSDFLNLVDKTRELMQDFSFTTDVIVGFPGETEEDFKATIDIANDVSFSKMHVFPYSKRAGTPAASMTNQISDDLKTSRAKIMRELSDILRKKEFLRRVGSCEFVVTENGNHATTDSYFTIKSSLFKGANELVNVELKEDMFLE